MSTRKPDRFKQAVDDFNRKLHELTWSKIKAANNNSSKNRVRSQ